MYGRERATSCRLRSNRSSANEVIAAQGMDSRIVNREIRREIWSALRGEGFDAFTARSAWRHLPDRAWLANFQSFNSYFSLVDGCTTFSFALNLGIRFDALCEPDAGKPEQNPKPHQCHFRCKLLKSIEQENYTRSDIWYVDDQGLNLLEVLNDARTALLADGLIWFNRFSELSELLRILVDENESDCLFGIGSRWSPRRKLLIGRATVATGDEEMGLRFIREAEAELESIRLQMDR